MVAPKICLMCKERIIQSWESVCAVCWRKVEKHDLCPMCLGGKSIGQENVNGGFTTIISCPECNGTGYTGKWHQWLIVLNHCREFLRSCGVDITELYTLW